VWDLQTHFHRQLHVLDSDCSEQLGSYLRRFKMLRGDAFDRRRDIVCQRSPESGLPPYVAARFKLAACGENDAPRLSETI
jgi:hypothetical protein